MKIRSYLSANFVDPLSWLPSPPTHHPPSPTPKTRDFTASQVRRGKIKTMALIETPTILYANYFTLILKYVYISIITFSRCFNNKMYHKLYTCTKLKRYDTGWTTLRGRIKHPSVLKREMKLETITLLIRYRIVSLNMRRRFSIKPHFKCVLVITRNVTALNYLF